MYPPNEDEIAFMTEGTNICYKVMPFSLKKARKTYQLLMDKPKKGPTTLWETGCLFKVSPKLKKKRRNISLNY